MPQYTEIKGFTHNTVAKTSWLINSVVVLRLTQHKIGHFGNVSSSQSLGLVWKKLNVTQQKHTFTNRKKCITTENKHKKPGLVAFHDMRPGN